MAFRCPTWRRTKRCTNPRWKPWMLSKRNAK
ncbi:MAG: hypothetical protein JJ967_09620 [Muricauda sp.]|nr:hypothetical protein [Allomuricauda sp.]